MTLVERFIEFQSWPTSKKSALLYGLALPFHVLATVWVLLVIDQYAWLDMFMVTTVYWGWSLELCLAFVISLIVARRGYEGYWTLWLNAIPYYLLMVVAISMFGFGSIAFVAWVPALLVLVAVWYGPRDGLLSACYMLGLIVVSLILLWLDVMPYAPALHDRSIDVQNDGPWMAHVLLVTLLYFVFCFVLLLLLMSARNLQERRLKETQQQLARSADLISRYVPPEVARSILNDENHDGFSPERVKLTVFYSSLDGFTEAADKLDPEDLSNLLNEYLSAMEQVAEKHGTTINQFVGDGIMVFFGGPGDKNYAAHAERALRMALDMQQRIATLEAQWRERGITQPLKARMGINTGYASVGDFGSQARKAYTAVGVQTSIAIGIHACCEPGGILMRDATWALVQDKVDAVEKGELKLEGVHMPVHVYTLACLRA